MTILYIGGAIYGAIWLAFTIEGLRRALGRKRNITRRLDFIRAQRFAR